MVSSTEGDAGMTLQRNQDKINKEGFLTMLLSSTSVAFTYFVFGLLEMFVSGYSQYWFGLMQILPVALFLFLSSTCVLLLLQLVFRGRTRNLVSGIVFGVGVGLYLQGNLPFFDYPALDRKRYSVDCLYRSSDSVILYDGGFAEDLSLGGSIVISC